MMEIRLFQWIVPLIASVFILNQYLRYSRGRINLGESIFVSLLWVAVALLAIFPDHISNFFADLLGIKSNTNAVLFLGMGFLFYFQYRLYRIVVHQRREITNLTRSLAIRDFESRGEE